jgi:outer membrane receptor protein involved in Fe transport
MCRTGCLAASAGISKPIALAAGLLGGTPVSAQAAHGLEEIIVTARRYSTSLNETPISVSALTGESLARSGDYDISDWQYRVPGLSFSNDGFGSHRTTIRGVTSGSLFEPRPLSAWYLDDAPMMTLAGNSSVLGPLVAPHPLAIDLARIEVLRGPQGTLFGSNALGGAVRQISNLPDTRRFAGWFDAGISTTAHGGESYEANAMLNVPLAAERAALRLVAYRHEEGGYIDNETRSINDIDVTDTTGGRFSALWNISEELTVTLRALGQRRTAGAISSTDVAAGPYLQRRQVPEQDVESWELFSFTIDYDMDWAKLTSSTTYIDRQPRWTFDVTSLTEPLVGFTIPTGNDFNDGIRDFIQEIRLVSAGGGKLSWVAGAYYETHDRSTHQNWRSPGFDAITGGLAAAFGYPDSPFHADYYSRLRQRAVYGDVSYELAPAWRASLGARWFEYTEQLERINAGLLAGGQNIGRADYRENGVTPRVGLEYRPLTDVLLFFNAAKGFRPGGGNEFTADVLERCRPDLDALGVSLPPDFKSETLWNFEVGARTEWLDKRLTATASVYHIDWDDMQTQFLLNGCGEAITENVGKAASDGLELELSWLASDTLELALSGSYIDARLEDDVPNLQGRNGQRIPTVPEWSASAVARKHFTLWRDRPTFVQADIQYVGGAWNLYDTSSRVWVPSRDIVNVRAGTRLSRWALDVYVENLFDERGIVYHNLNFLGEWQVLIRPRTIGMRVRVDF